MSDPKLFFWLASPPFVELGPIRSLASIWRNEIHVISLSALREERRTIGWAEAGGTMDNISFHSLAGRESKQSLECLDRTRASHHVFNGLSGLVGEMAMKLIRSRSVEKVTFMTERPGVYGSGVTRLKRRVGLNMKYSVIRNRLATHTAALMPLGDTGARQFVHMGWPEDIVLPYMYCPPETDQICPADPMIGLDAKSRTGGKANFLYAGRLCRTTKGIDTLMAAFDQIPPGTVALDIVGAYGPDADEVKRWARSRPDITMLGNWSTQDLQRRMSHYDCAIVPSRFDGWNVTVNIALRNGVGVICTTDCVSDELVRNSGAGVVIDTGDANALAAEVLKVGSSPDLAFRWHRLAEDYRELISPSAVGDYLASCLRYASGVASIEKPTRPWVLS